MAVDVIQDTQKKGTTYRQQLTELMLSFNKLVENGGDTSENFGKMLSHLLKSFEGVYKIRCTPCRISYCLVNNKSC